MKTIICLVGETGSGKDTVASLLPWPKVVSYTTRGIRDGEKDGREHYFITKSEMNEMKNQANIMAYTNKGGAEYCAIEPTDGIYVYIINPDGIDFLNKKYKNKDNVKLIIIGLYLPLSERIVRCRIRSDFETKFLDRVANEELDFSKFRLSGEYHAMLRNSNSSVTADIIKEMVAHILYDMDYNNMSKMSKIY